MAKAVIQANIQTASGAITVAPNASVAIRDADTAALVSLWTDRAGTIAADNPVTADASGFFRVYATVGRVNITATHGGTSQSWNDVVLNEDINALLAGSPSQVFSVATATESTHTLPRSQLNASSGSSEIGFIQSGTGAVARTVQSKLRDTINVLDFGATGDGTTDDTAAIQAAIDAAAAGSIIYFSVGTYKYSTLTISKALTLDGESRSTTSLTSTSTTANTIAITGQHVVLSNLRFAQTGTITAGSLINYQTGAHNGIMKHCSLYNYFGGVKIESLGVLLDNVIGTDATPAATSAGSYHVSLTTNHLENIWIRQCSFANSSSTPTTYGLKISNGASFFISDTDFRCAQYGLVLDPGTGQLVANTNFANCFFDTNQVGCYIAPSSTGYIINIRFTNCWTSGSKDISGGSHGVLIDAAGGYTGSIDGIHLINHNATGNTGSGVSLVDGSNLSIIGGDYANNAGDGVTIAANLNNFKIIGACIGSGSYYAGNAGYGINVAAGTSNYYNIIGNDVTGNTTSSINDLGTGTSKFVHSNAGYNSAIAGYNRLSKTAAYTLTTPDCFNGPVYLSADATGGAFTVTLPASSTAMYPITILKANATANNITIAPASGVIIEAGATAATIALTTTYEKVTLISTGTNWAVISRLA